MAEKRMFTMKICDSDAFLEMPLSTQCLYFHLNMRADDDGFVNNPKKILRVINASDDDLKLLIAKRFLLVFAYGVIVIKHWRMHNTIQSDRYKPTVYQDEIKQLSVKENKSYKLLSEEVENVSKVETKCFQTVSAGLDIDKDIDKERDKDTCSKIERKQLDFDLFWKAYPRKVGKSNAIKAWKKVKVDIDVILNAIEKAKTSAQWQDQNGRFIPYPASWLNSGGWDDEIMEVKEKEDWRNF